MPPPAGYPRLPDFHAGASKGSCCEGSSRVGRHQGVGQVGVHKGNR